MHFIQTSRPPAEEKKCCPCRQTCTDCSSPLIMLHSSLFRQTAYQWKISLALLVSPAPSSYPLIHSSRDFLLLSPPFCLQPLCLKVDSARKSASIQASLYLQKQHGVSYICHQLRAIRLFKHTFTPTFTQWPRSPSLQWGSDACRAVRSNRKAVCADGLGPARKSPSLIL